MGASSAALPKKESSFDVEYEQKLVAGEEGRLRFSSPANCLEVLLEFDAKTVWVSGDGRVPGSTVFRLTPGEDHFALSFGTVADKSATSVISIFARDANGAVLARRDCIVRFEKPATPSGQLGEIIETFSWFRQRVRWATYAAAILAIVWPIVKIHYMSPDEKIRYHLARERYVGDWDEDFWMKADSSGSAWDSQGEWNVAAHKWKIGNPSTSEQSRPNPPSPASTGRPSDDRVKGHAGVATPAWGMPTEAALDGEEFYDFMLQLRADLPSQGEISFALRAQSGERGYVFTIKPSNGRIHIEADARHRWFWRIGPKSDTRLLPIQGIYINSDCCRDGDYIDLEMAVSKYQFKIESLTLRNNQGCGERPFCGRPQGKWEFRDGYETFLHGTLALFAENGTAPASIDWIHIADAK